MNLEQFLLLYGFAGVGVAAAVFLTGAGPAAQQCFQVVSAVLFWPLYLPIVLTKQDVSAPPLRPAAQAADDLGLAIAQADAELESAVRSLDGWAEGVLAREQSRLGELRQAWFAQAERIREMDRLLAQSEVSPRAPSSLTGPTAPERMRNSQLAIARNLERLRRVRERTFDDLMGTLTWVRELVSMIHLAKFTGEPAARAEDLVSQIAAAVEGVSAFTWQDELSKDNGEPLSSPSPPEYRWRGECSSSGDPRS